MGSSSGQLKSSLLQTLTTSFRKIPYLRPMAKKITTTKTGSKKESSHSDRKETSANTLAFNNQNYYIILAGIGILVLGYLLMIGGEAASPNEFNPEIFSARRITVAPITLLIGFGVVLYGIMKSPKQPTE